MQFIWFWVPAPDNGLELRLSMRSVVKNFCGEKRLTVIGDKPPWYRGHHIPCSKVVRIRGERPDRVPFRDTQRKIMVAASHPEVDEEFIWIMDDTFLLRLTTREDLAVPRYDPWYRQNHRREWHKLIAATFAALRAKGYPALQYGTHLPMVFEKQKLLQMFVEFNFPKAMLLFEISYSNRFRESAIEYRPFLTRLQRSETAKQLDARAETANVLNYVSNVWGKTMKAWLLQRFPESTEFEG